MVRLLIHHRIIDLHSTDNVTMRVSSVLVEVGRDLTPLYAADSFANVTDVSISLDRNRRFFRWSKLNLPASLRQAIAQTLTTYHAKQDLSFDCYAFANLVASIPRHDKLFLMKNWNVTKLRRRPPIGGIVFLLDMKNGIFHHAAVYLGHGLYISIYGAGGDLEVATLNDMSLTFSPSEPFLATPRI